MKQRILLIAATAVLAQAAVAATLTVSPAAQVKVLGAQATIEINASGGYVGDFDLDISWNPGIVSLFDIDYGTQLGFSIQNPFAIGAGTVNASEISLESPADLMALQPGQTATLLTLVFNTIATGTSPVNISVSAVGDENGLPHQVLDLANGSITVRDPGGPGQEIPEPTSALLAGFGVVLLGIGLKRSKNLLGTRS